MGKAKKDYKEMCGALSRFSISGRHSKFTGNFKQFLAPLDEKYRL